MMHNANQSATGLHHRADEAPPPPYSETDIYSNSASSPRIANEDGAASRQSSSPVDDVILTPPETPRTSASDPLSQGATLYFESRPPPPTPPFEPLVHIIDVGSTSSPADFPYQSGWAARDVTPQDWATFINFLLPDHTARGNESVFERKLNAQGAPDDASSAHGRSEAEAHFLYIRESSPQAVRRKADADSTVQQWNAAFFGPRGIHVHLVSPHGLERMPGSWDAVLDAHGPPRPGGPQPPLPFPQQPQQRLQTPRSRNWGGFTIGDDGIRYGNRFVADNSGLRIGSLVMDNSGIRINGQGNEPTSRVYARPPASAPWPPPGVLSGGLPCEPQPRQRRQYDHVGGWEGRHERRSRKSCEERGRRRRSETPGSLQRCDSVSSASSSSSTSSSSSESSIGSLPDYDDIRDQQLPLYVERLQDWTANPDRPPSKSDVKKLKTDLQTAKRAPVDPTQDRKRLRAQMKVLSQQWRQLKKQQKSVRRAARRERQQRRRADKKERRQSRREAREARRALRRGRSGSGAPTPPPVPGIIPATAVAAVGLAHHASRGGFGPGLARGGHFGGFFGPSQPCFYAGGAHGPFGPNGFGERGPPGPRGLFAGRGSRGCGPPWGRGRGGPLGRGGLECGPPWDGHSHGASGAWPEAGKSRGNGPETGVGAPPPGPVSVAMYRDVEDLEAEIRVKAKQAAELGGGAQRPDREMEALTARLERVRMQADEAYARELSAQEEPH